MSDIRVYGGLQVPKAKRPSDIVLDPAVPHGQPGHVNIRLHELTRKLLTNLPSRLTDLLEIASYVYAADQLVRRDSVKMPDVGVGWRRSFQFHVAVRDMPFWSRQDVLDQLKETLEFLTDDTFHFSFSKINPGPRTQAYFEYSAEGPTSQFRPDEVMLFSGGLDSFAGALDALEERQQRIVLVSHRASPMVASYQNRLVTALRQRSGYDRVLHLSVEITRGHGKAVEFTQRSRSFLFATLGFLIAHLFERRSISFYENGIVSINLPLSRHVVGSRASRTTHPRVLHEFGALFSLVTARDFKVANPFFWKTKAEVVRRIADLGAGSLIPSTFSCASVREATKQSGRHCGICSQCLDRRFGVLAAGCGPFEPPEIYDIELLRGERLAGAETIMAEAYVLAAHQHAGASEQAFISDNIEVLRAAPYLDGLPLDEAVSRLHRLHQRHGQGVSTVVEQSVANSASIAATLALPNGSLLAMITGSHAQDIICREPAELEPSPATQAELRPLQILQRPILFMVPAGGDRAIFADKVVLSGKAAQLVNVLLPNFMCTQFMKVGNVALSLRMTEGALRTLISRTRAELSDQFHHIFGVELAIDDVIENDRWNGYRLNPCLAYVPLPDNEAVVLAAE